MKYEEVLRDEFEALLNDDEVFKLCWGNEGEEQGYNEFDFIEWVNSHKQGY